MRYIPDPVLKLYQLTPAWSRSLASSLYGSLKNRKEITPQFIAALADLRGSERLPLSRLQDIQADRLTRLVRHAAVNVPYYARLFAEYGLIPSQIQGPEDLRKVPVLTKETIRQKAASLIAHGYDRWKLRSESTSGSSGVPLTVWMDEGAYAYTKAVQWLQHGWAGYTHKEWIGILAGYRVIPVGRKRPPFWTSNYAGKQIHFSTYHLKPQFMPAMVTKLKESGVQFLLGYPSAIALLARHIVDTGDRVPLKAIFPSSEPTFAWQHQAVAAAFGARMFNYYGQGERAISGTGCGYSMDLHINMEMCVAELRDPPAGGSYKHLVGTPLFNYAMPLLRYELNDLTSKVDGPCPCGREHERIGPVETLSDHYLVGLDGALISPSVVYLAFPTLKGLSGAQVAQEDQRTLVVKVIAGEAFTAEESAKLLKGLRSILGDGFDLQIQRVSEIPLSKSGKSRFVVSKPYLDLQKGHVRSDD